MVMASLASAPKFEVVQPHVGCCHYGSDLNVMRWAVRTICIQDDGITKASSQSRYNGARGVSITISKPSTNDFRYYAKRTTIVHDPCQCPSCGGKAMARCCRSQDLFTAKIG